MTTAPVQVDIQDLPTVASYGVQPGQITHAMLILQALELGQGLNALQALQDGAVFDPTNPGKAVVNGQTAITSNLGIQAPDAGVELSPAPGGGEMDTLSDPSGDFQMFVPLGDTTFNYATSDFELFDPVAGTVMSSETVDMTTATSGIPLVISALSGTCNDDDINSPDGDDPDCD